MRYGTVEKKASRSAESGAQRPARVALESVDIGEVNGRNEDDRRFLETRMLPDHVGQLEAIDTTQWYPRIMRKDFAVGLNVSESAVDDPDQQFYENYVCTAERNYTGYCNPEVDKLVDQQSAESSNEKRKQLVWEIERRLAEDGARPVIFCPRQATCRHPQVKGMTMMVNSIYNGFRYEDLWLDD